MIHFSEIHLPKGDTLFENDTLTKGRYTYQREIHLPKGDTLTKGEIHLSKGDTLTKGRRYTFRIMIHFSNNDTLFE